MKKLVLLSTFLLIIISAFSQSLFPCNGKFLFTRQYPAAPQPNSYISQVDFIPGDINISNQGTVNNPVGAATSVNVNASCLHAGYIWAQNWTNTTAFELLRIAADYTTTPFLVAGMPAGTTYNNAGVDQNGRMYILTNANPVQIYAIDLTATTATLVIGYPKTVNFSPVLGTTDAVIWGDIAFDPITNRCYCWYHPTATPAAALGLYEITGLSTTTPTCTKVGVAQSYTLGSLFFNDRGQLFGYGGTLGSTQDRIFAIDKAGGTVVQYGIPDIAVTQSDGASCAFRISLDRQVSVPFLNVPKCGVDTFKYTFTTRNYTVAGATSISFGDTLDSRLSYAFSAATLQTQLQATYGGAVVVMLSSYGGGTNNRVNITGMNLPIGAASFTLPVKVDANNFAASVTIIQQAQLGGIATNLGGPNEPSNDPTTFNPKDATAIVITLSGTKCLPPISNNFINTPMPQGNAATAILGLVSADPDGTISTYKIVTFPLATEGVLTYCSNGTSPCTGTVTAINVANTILTPAQMSTLKFDPAGNFVGTAQFTFNATDNSNNVSNTATYQLPVTAQPPVSNNIMENSMPNTNGATAIAPLNSADVDGTIASYQITSVPPAAQGVLSVPCPPNLLGGSCVGSFQDLTATVLGNYPSGIPLTAAQIVGMRFDPTAGFVGNAMFNYNATDNSGNVSNTANYTIPVTATATNARPPLADNITAQPINNSNGPVSIPSLKANDLDGTIASYTIQSFPPASQGVLSYCSNGTSPCTGTVTPISGSTVLTPAQAATLKFDPAPGFVGNASFTYIATDNTGLVSNVANYTIPIVNTPPTAVNINTIAPFNGSAAAIVPLSGTDLDGTVDSLKITTLPTGGVLSVPCIGGIPPNGGSACSGGFSNLTSIPAGGIALTPAQAAAIRFAPNTGFSGTTTFNYISKDNNGNISSPATYTITVPNQPPVSNDLTAPVMPNTNGATLLSPLSSSDPDGTISNYTIFSIPPPTSGTLTYCSNSTEPCSGTITSVTAGTVLTAAQMATLKFDPAANYTGVVNFTYGATDNSGNVSNVANYNIPISGVGNLPPIANNIVAPVMPNTNGATAIPALIGNDPDGTVANYTINTVPPVSQGVLSYCSNGTSPCSGIVTTIAAGTVLTAAQIATLKFDPTAGFVGNATFSYFDTDNSGVVSNLATYTLPVSGTPPISNPIVAPAMAQTNAATAIPGLVSADADGSIANYTIETIPPASQGLLTYCSNGTAPCTGAVTNITAGTVLTAAQMATLKFTPSGSYQGNVIFNYHATDNSGLNSNSTTYTIPVTGQPPVSQDILAPKMLNTLGATAIPSLVANDPDGTIATYVIASIPPANQGVLSYCSNGTAPCTGSFIDITSIPLGGLVLTPAQMATLQFDPNASFNGNAVFNYASFDNNGNISNIATYTIPVGSSSVLPVSLINFDAKRLNDDISLHWNTENEINVNKYEVEYSTDGIRFFNGGSVIAKNLSNNNYQFNLSKYTNYIYYLRLKIVENNGSFNYSNIVVVKLNSKKDEILVYPTPANDFVNVEFNGETKGEYTIQLFDASGKLVYGINNKNVQVNQKIRIQKNQLSSGIYIMKIISALYATTTYSKVVFK